MNTDKKPVETSTFSNHFKVCTASLEFMKIFSHIKLDTQNPMIKRDVEFRQLMIERKRIHYLFDLIKCQKWIKIFEKTNKNHF